MEIFTEIIPKLDSHIKCRIICVIFQDVDNISLSISLNVNENYVILL